MQNDRNATKGVATMRNICLVLVLAMLIAPTASAKVGVFDFCANTSAGTVTCVTDGLDVGTGTRIRIYIENDTACSGAPSVIIQGRDSSAEMWHDIITLATGASDISSIDDISAYTFIRGSTITDVTACTGFNIKGRTRLDLE